MHNLLFIPAVASLGPVRPRRLRSTSPRTPPFRVSTTCVLDHDPPSPTPEYARDEGLDSPDAATTMAVWNYVIHASLKRKLHGLVGESPVASGVSALIGAAPGYAGEPVAADATHAEVGEEGEGPVEVVEGVLSEFRRDALEGAVRFIAVASERNHVKKVGARRLVLFVGDNESYRVLLRVQRFACGEPKWGSGGCVLRVEVSGAEEEEQVAVFDFQMVRERGRWQIDEIFRL